MGVLRFLLCSLFFLVLTTGKIIAQDYAELYDQLKPSVVTIETDEFRITKSQLNQSRSTGSGVIIDSSGLILTAAHVVASANTISVKLSSGQKYTADILASAPSADLALLQLRAPFGQLKPAVIGNSDSARVGSQILIIGSPLGLEYSLSVGHISGKQPFNRLLNGEQAGLIQTDASINPGNSGGPMFDQKGRLIGIVSFILTKSGGFEGIGFAVDVSSAQKILLEKNSFWTGFDGLFMDEIIAGIFNVPNSRPGLLVQRVTANSFADHIGLKGGFFEADILGQTLWLGGDIILSIQKITCDTPHNFSLIKDIVKNYSAGEKLTMEVLRRGKIITLGN